MATNSPGATGSRERRFRNTLGASWELGAWEFIAQNGLLGGHLGNQNHWLARMPPSPVEGLIRCEGFIRSVTDKDLRFETREAGQRCSGMVPALRTSMLMVLLA